jgi:transmembrane sensor
VIRFWAGREARASREASAWMARLRGTPTQEDRAAFQSWQLADPLHAAAYARLTRRWQGQLSKIAQTPTGRARDLGRQRPRPRLQKAFAATACALIAVAVIFLGPSLFSGPATAQTSRFETGPGEIKTVTLADGSHVTLDTRTIVDVVIDARTRRLTIAQGRARFSVHEDPKRVFIVDAAVVTIVSSDGVFDVDRAGFGARVGLVSGSARTVGKDIALPTGKTVAYGGVSKLDSAASLDWPSGILIFKDLPMAEVVAEANRYARVPIMIDDRAAKLRVTATYRAADTEGLARSLATAFDLRLARGQDAYRLSVKLPATPSK